MFFKKKFSESQKLTLPIEEKDLNINQFSELDKDSIINFELVTPINNTLNKFIPQQAPVVNLKHIEVVEQKHQVKKKSPIQQAPMKPNFQDFSSKQFQYGVGSNIKNRCFIPKIGENPSTYGNDHLLDFQKVICFNMNFTKQILIPDSDSSNEGNQQIFKIEESINQKQEEDCVQMKIEQAQEDNRLQLLQEQAPNLALEHPLQSNTNNNQPNSIDQNVLDQNIVKIQTEDQQNSPDKHSPYPQIIKNLKIDDLLPFLLSPAPKGGMIQCFIRRSNSGFNRVFPVYKFYLQQNECFLCAGKEVYTKDYIVSRNKEDFAYKGPHYLARMKRNAKNYTFYDDGRSPDDKSFVRSLRCELGAIIFDHRLDSNKKLREIKVLIGI